MKGVLPATYVVRQVMEPREEVYLQCAVRLQAGTFHFQAMGRPFAGSGLPEVRVDNRCVKYGGGEGS